MKQYAALIAALLMVSGCRTDTGTSGESGTTAGSSTSEMRPTDTELGTRIQEDTTDSASVSSQQSRTDIALQGQQSQSVLGGTSASTDGTNRAQTQTQTGVGTAGQAGTSAGTSSSVQSQTQAQTQTSPSATTGQAATSSTQTQTPGYGQKSATNGTNRTSTSAVGSPGTAGTQSATSTPSTTPSATGQTPGATDQSAIRNRPPVTPEESDQDGELSARVRAELIKQDATATTAALSAQTLAGIKITSSNGNVRLRGTVSSEDEKRRIEEKVRKVTGVQSVDNQLQVSGQGSPAVGTEGADRSQSDTEKKEQKDEDASDQGEDKIDDGQKSRGP
jgi:osmotically-inducible protein OsmY